METERHRREGEGGGTVETERPRVATPFDPLCADIDAGWAVTVRGGAPLGGGGMTKGCVTGQIEEGMTPDGGAPVVSALGVRARVVPRSVRGRCAPLLVGFCPFFPLPER